MTLTMRAHAAARSSGSAARTAPHRTEDALVERGGPVAVCEVVEPLARMLPAGVRSR